MKCSEVQELLSDFYDGEVPSEAQSAIARHLSECEDCAAELAGFEKVTRAVNQLEQTEVPGSIWANLSDKLAGTEQATLQTLDRRHASWWWTTSQQLALAASILLLLGGGLWINHYVGHGDQEHAADLVATMDQYLQTFSTDPAAAEQLLLSKYDGRPVNSENIVQLIGYHPAVLEGLPPGYRLVSTDVLTMPCCTCVKATCRRDDGSTLVLFEHDDEQMEWFGKRPANMAMCGDKECCLVDLDSSLAATWKRGSRSLTAVGARNVDELNSLVTWLDEKVQTTL